MKKLFSLLMFAAAVATISCTGSIDETRIDDLEADMYAEIAAINQKIFKIEDIENPLSDLADRVGKLEEWFGQAGASGGGADHSAEIATLSRELKIIQQNLTAINKEIQDFNRDIADLKKARPSSGGSSSSAPRSATLGSSSASKQPAGATAKPVKQKTPEPTKSVGHYYTVQDGDTIESIAAKYGMSSVDLRKENPLFNKDSRQPMTNTRLWVPRPRPSR